MIIGINGAFGAGKTQAAYELQRRRKGAYVYDPENLGFLSGTTFLPPLFREHPVNDKAQASCQQQTAWTSVFRLHPAKAEGCDQLLQHAGLGAQLLTGSGALLGGGRVGLHHTIEICASEAIPLMVSTISRAPATTLSSCLAVASAICVP